jgi:hypothetical protein
VNLERYFILDDENRPKPADLMTWGRWFENNNRVVDFTQITSALSVSTVFLGIDHRHFGSGPPLLFETMVFDGNGDTLECHRYVSWDDAVTGHRATVRRLRG